MNLDEEILRRLKVDEEEGILFEDGIQVLTQSGSIYQIAPDGVMVCTKGKREGKIVGMAIGSVYRVHGPMRIAEAVIGLSIEATREQDGVRRVFITSPVEEIHAL